MDLPPPVPGLPRCLAVLRGSRAWGRGARGPVRGPCSQPRGPPSAPLHSQVAEARRCPQPARACDSGLRTSTRPRGSTGVSSPGAARGPTGGAVGLARGRLRKAPATAGAPKHLDSWTVAGGQTAGRAGWRPRPRGGRDGARSSRRRRGDRAARCGVTRARPAGCRGDGRGRTGKWPAVSDRRAGGGRAGRTVDAVAGPGRRCRPRLQLGASASCWTAARGSCGHCPEAGQAPGVDTRQEPASGQRALETPAPGARDFGFGFKLLFSGRLPRKPGAAAPEGQRPASDAPRCQAAPPAQGPMDSGCRLGWNRPPGPVEAQAPAQASGVGA